jgi:hypothetical protein
MQYLAIAQNPWLFATAEDAEVEFRRPKETDSFSVSECWSFSVAPVG